MLISAAMEIGALLSSTAESAELNGAVQSSSPTVSPAVVSEDPYTNPRTYHRTQVEPDAAASASTVVSVFQSGRSYRCGASNIGWSVTRDAGTTWTDGFLPNTTPHATPSGEWRRVTDPAIAYDAKHGIWLAQGLGIPSCPFAGGDVFVSRSSTMV